MNILGVGGLDHNGSLTFSKDHRLVSFLEAERPTRKKNVGLKDEETLDLLLRCLSIEEVDRIGVADQAFWRIQRPRLEPALTKRFSAPIDVWHHHDCHVASGLIASPWDRALCVSIDGKGDDLSAMAAVVSRERGVEERLIEIPSANSIGRLWWAVSEFCGFPGHHSAGKTMALAAYGEPFDLFESVSSYHSNGTFSFRAPDDHPDTFREVSRIHDWIVASVSRCGRDPESCRADVAASLQDLTTRAVSPLCQDSCRLM